MSNEPARILVVVADEGRRQAWCAALAAAGLRNEAVAGAAQAVAAARWSGAPPPALLAVDASLPGMGPALLARALRSLPGLAELPVLVLGGDVPAGLGNCAAAGEPAAVAGMATILLSGGSDAPPLPVEPVLDAAVVARVRSYGEPMFQQLVGQYLDELPQRLGEVAQAIARSDLSAARGIAHALKGSSGSLGMPLLWKACAGLENACRDRVGAETALEEVRRRAAEAGQAMRQELARPGGVR
jgi:HPt (histidine-containing phosphotransfer) domain-containing protein